MKNQWLRVWFFLTSALSIILLTGAINLNTMDTTSADNTTAPGFTESNPFAHESALLYHVPQFDKIRDADYAPAMEEGMRLKLSEIEQIASNPEPPTFDNTIIAMEKSGKLLNRVLPVFFSMTRANTNNTLQKILSEEAPRLAANSDAIMLNDKLFERVRSIHDQSTSLGLTPQQKRLLERYYLDFVQSGALLSDPDKERLKAINQEAAILRTDFQDRLLKATANGALVVDDETMLDGLTEAEIAAAAQAAGVRGLHGKWVVPLQNTTQQPAQARLSNRNLRKELFDKSTLRTELGDSNDTRQIIIRLTELRTEKARLLGHNNFAEYTFQNRMAKTPAAAIKLLTDIAAAAMAKTEREAAKIQELAVKQNGRIELKPWDWQYYAEKVRSAGYNLDEARLKPYFELNRVLKDGVFFAAGKLYGLTFRERDDIPVYHPDVQVFEVFDAEGQSIALWYCDYFKRDNKHGGAWSGEYFEFSRLLQTSPVVFNVCNYTKPAPGQPALLSYNDVTTMFHEFGHALHSLLNRTDYPRLASNVPEDFVEVPSQFNEHWALYPEVLDNYAKHYATDEPMPEDLVERVRKAKTFNMGFATLEYLEASLLDMAWHTLPPGTEISNIESFETEVLQRYNVYMPLVPPRYRSTYFAHIWENGYSAGYYSYMWSEVIENDAFEWFKANGGLTRANGQRFRDMILSRIGSEDPDILYREFRGQDPDIKAMLEERGLTEE